MSFTFAGRYGPEACFSTTGALLASTDVTVYESDGVTLADLYDDRTKASPADNPASTDSRGNLSFFAEPGDYVLDVEGSTVEVSVPVDTVEVSTDAEAAAAVAAHSGDATAAHTASAVSFTPTGSLVSTTVQAALVELDDDLSGLSSDAADIVFDDTGLTSVVGDDVQAALEAVDAALQSGTSAAAVTFSPTGSIAATDVQAAIAEVASEAAAFETLTVNAQTGTTYTLVLADGDHALVTLSNAGAITVTLPQDSAVAIPVGRTVYFMQLGAGQVTLAAGTGATVNGTPTLKSRAQYSMLAATKRAANTWVVFGDVAAT